MKVIKLHRSLVDAVLLGLKEIFNQNIRADKVVAGIIKSNAKWGSRDRAFIAENIYDIVRNWRLVKFCTDIDQKNNSDEDFYKLMGTWFLIKEYDISMHDFLQSEANGVLKDKLKKAEKVPKIKYSVTDWLDELGVTEFGKDWPKFLEASHQKAEVYLRVNTQKTTQEKLIAALKTKQIETEVVSANTLKFLKRVNVNGLEEYNKGHFEIQDAGSQMISEYLDVKSGHTVIDACAGAGGKTLHLADIMQNQGKIIAMDLEEHKLVELQNRAKRNGIKIISTELIDNKVLKSLEATADRLLLDVPCSGLGVLKRNPYTKWFITENYIKDLEIKQAEILDRYSAMLKPNGKMVYATCSILKRENEDQVAAFLKKSEDFKLVSEKRILPHVEGFDGFYMALIEKK